MKTWLVLFLSNWVASHGRLTIAIFFPGFERGGHIDNAIITLRFVGGALGVIDNSLVAGYGYECSSEIMGSKATLHIGNHRRTSVEVLTAGGIYHDQVSDFVERFGTAYRAEMESFVAVSAALWPTPG